MTADIVKYLNRGDFYSRLREQIFLAKVPKMPPSQWISFIRGLSSKGVKQTEVDEVGLIKWLSENKEKSVTKDEMLSQYDRLSVTVKEVSLGSPKYRGHSHAGPEDEYFEFLYIANSEAGNITDRIEEIEFQMEELTFDYEMLLKNPGLATKLEAERRGLMTQKPNAVDFDNHHFSDKIKGKHGKNCLFHARVVIAKKPNGKSLFFIDEIQSDWGQTGRVRKSIKDQFVPPGETRRWVELSKEEQDEYRKQGVAPPNWRSNVPVGPWVMDTKLWAGLAVRRLFQMAAARPDVDEVSWIRLCMRNGGGIDPRELDARIEAQRDEDDTEENETDHYYRKVIPELANSVLGKSGVRVGFDSTVSLNGRNYGALPGFLMTDAARDVLKAKQPLYSASEVLRNPPVVSDERLQALVRHGRFMLGSAARIRFTASLMDFQTMSFKSGSYMNRLMTLALNSKDLFAAMNHESYHCACDLFLSQSEINRMNSAFHPGGELNELVRKRLIARGDDLAAKQCRNPEEAAAHAFALWSAKEIDLGRGDSATESVGIFSTIKNTFVAVVHWIAGESMSNGYNTPEEVFMALRDGDLSKRYMAQNKIEPEPADLRVVRESQRA